MTRILLVDDELLFRLGLRELLSLQPDLQVVAEASSVEDALRLLQTEAVDLLLVDIRLPGATGIDLVQALRAGGSTVPVLLLSTFDDDEAFFEGLKLGAHGFLRKDVTLKELATAIAAVMRGERYLKPVVTESARRELERSSRTFERADQPERMTPREVEVLRLMAAGLSNREIAAAFGTSDATVKSQVSSIIAKLGVRDRIRAVLVALEKGYL
jgi:DNA-binding NarL/FixJ family response regulator